MKLMVQTMVNLRKNNELDDRLVVGADADASDGVDIVLDDGAYDGVNKVFEVNEGAIDNVGTDDGHPSPKSILDY